MQKVPVFYRHIPQYDVSAVFLIPKKPFEKTRPRKAFSPAAVLQHFHHIGGGQTKWLADWHEQQAAEPDHDQNGPGDKKRDKTWWARRFQALEVFRGRRCLPLPVLWQSGNITWGHEFRPSASARPPTPSIRDAKDRNLPV